MPKCITQQKTSSVPLHYMQEGGVKYSHILDVTTVT